MFWLRAVAVIGLSLEILYFWLSGGDLRAGERTFQLLSQVSGHVSTGEIVHLWARGLGENELCGCGATFLECPFWTKVGEEAFGGWDRLRVDEIVRLQRRVDRNRYIIFMMFPRRSGRYRRDLEAYADLLARLYRAIFVVAGAVTIVDSSKHASTAFLLRRVHGVRVRVVHLVRDSRGVAHSLLKQVRRPEAVDGRSYMHRASPWRSGLEWLAFNTLFHLLRATRTPVTRMRYEDLVRDPRGALRSVLSFEGATWDPEELAFIDDAGVSLGTDHTVSGNPMRLNHGRLELRLDEAWRRSMRPSQRVVTTALTWPLLALYRYPMRATS
jgi:hypothetical protein